LLGIWHGFDQFHPQAHRHYSNQDIDVHSPVAPDATDLGRGSVGCVYLALGAFISGQTGEFSMTPMANALGQ
jgi:hypothetical protein